LNNFFLNLYLQPQKNSNNIINRRENDESRYRSKIPEKLGLEGDVQATAETL
jgi:hypothetical protein